MHLYGLGMSRNYAKKLDDLVAVPRSYCLGTVKGPPSHTYPYDDHALLRGRQYENCYKTVLRISRAPGSGSGDMTAVIAWMI